MTAIASLDLQVGDTPVPVHGTVTIPPGLDGGAISFSFAGLRPAALAKASPALAMLGGLDAAVDGEGRIDAGSGAPAFDLQLTSRPGILRVMGVVVPLTAASLHASGTPDSITLRGLRLVVHPPSSDAATSLAVSGTLHRAAGKNTADLSLDLDRLRFADLPALWPEGLAGDARRWVTENITDGTAHDGHASIRLAANDDLSMVQVSRIDGTLPANGLTVHWLRPVPAAMDGQAVLRITDPNALEIDIASGQQAANGADAPPLTIAGGTVRITGLEQPDQIASVDLHLTGAVPTVLGLLSHPRMDLLARAKVPVRNAEGRVDGSVTVTLPLLARLRLDQVGIATQDHLSGLRLPGILAGQTLSQGDFELTANKDGMRLQGHGVLGRFRPTSRRLSISGLDRRTRRSRR